MKKNETKKLIIIYLGYILLTGLICMLIAGWKPELFLGLFIGATAAIFNYFLLVFAIRVIVGKSKTFGVQFYIMRFLVYFLTAYASVRICNGATIMFAVGVIGLSVAIFITYGIGGMKEQ